jgi:hypothetical protein
MGLQVRSKKPPNFSWGKFKFDLWETRREERARDERRTALRCLRRVNLMIHQLKLVVLPNKSDFQLRRSSASSVAKFDTAGDRTSYSDSLLDLLEDDG